MRTRDIVPLLKETFASWREDKAPRLAAALAYYTVFSIAPLVIITIAVAGFFLGPEAASGQIQREIQHTLGPQSASAINDIVENAARNKGHGVVATVIGIAALLLGAAGVFGQLKDALNTVWGVEPNPERGFKGAVIDNFLSMSMVLGIGFLLLVSLVLSAGIAGFVKFAGALLPALTWLGPILDLVLSAGLTTVLFALIYRVLPDAQIQWRDVWVGAFITAVLFTVGKFLIGLYLGRSSVGSAYGAAGSLVVLLLWVYYSAQLLLFGAEFTKVYALKLGSRIVPEDGAVVVTREARAEQGMPERRAA